jgi:zinc protease
MKRLIFGISLVLLSLKVTHARSPVSFEEDSTLPVVRVAILVRSGAVTDPKGLEGLTHFLSEMLPRGTRTRSREQLENELDSLGASLAVETRLEASIIRGAVLSKSLPQFLSILEEILVAPRFSEMEIQKLKKETLSGLLQEYARDAQIAQKRFQKFLFGTHPYGTSIHGTKTSIPRIQRDTLISAHSKWFREGSLEVLATGNAKKADFEKFYERFRSLRPKLEATSHSTWTPIPTPPLKRRVLLLDKPDRTQTQILIGQLGKRFTDPDYFALHIANQAFGGGNFSARMMKEIRGKRGWSYGAYSYFRHGLHPRLWWMYSFPASKDTAATLKLSLEMFEDFSKNGITREEYEFAKTSLIQSSGFSYNTPEKRMENHILESSLDLPSGFMSSFAERLSPVTYEDVQKAIRGYFRPDRLSILVLGTASELQTSVRDAAKVELNDLRIQSYLEE